MIYDMTLGTHTHTHTDFMDTHVDLRDTLTQTIVSKVQQSNTYFSVNSYKRKNKLATFWGETLILNYLDKSSRNLLDLKIYHAWYQWQKRGSRQLTNYKLYQSLYIFTALYIRYIYFLFFFLVYNKNHIFVQF